MARRREVTAGEEERGAESDRAGEARGLPSRHDDRARRGEPAATGTLTVHVPLTFVRRGGVKRMMAPDGKPIVAEPRQGAPANTPIVRALARAFRWRRMIEAGEFATVREIAEAEGVNASHVSRVLRLTLLAPGILERLIEGSVAGNGLTVEALLEPFPVSWPWQLETFSNPRLERPPCATSGHLTRPLNRTFDQA